MKKVLVKNPIIPLDYPDPDVIRVEDTYYMVSTTMYFFPGCEILKSTDLVNWEHASFVYKTLDSTDSQKLANGKNIYGQGMWAATFRHHKGKFYILFSANDTHKTYLFTSTTIKGAWEKKIIEGFYHDASLLFDDDGRQYLVHGNSDIYLTELNNELSGPLRDGINRCIISEKKNAQLGYEGAHFYKINGFYYLFLIHSLPEKWMRVQACFMTDNLNNAFTGCDILIDDLDLAGQGVAQGGIVDTPEGDWYSILFQDSGAVGRLPILVPVTWENQFPKIGKNKKVPKSFYLKKKTGDYDSFGTLIGSDDFSEWSSTPYKLKPFWQFNHEPDPSQFKIDTEKGYFELLNGNISTSILDSRNTLTQRMLYPYSSCEVTIDGRRLKNGDISGLCAFQSAYGFVGLLKEKDNYFIVMRAKELDDDRINPLDPEIKEQEYEKTKVNKAKVTFKIEADFHKEYGHCQFYYKKNNKFIKLGINHELAFKLDFFTGCRYGLFSYASVCPGGIVRFSNFKYNHENSFS